MQTRYTPLVKLKKSAMEKSERSLMQANATLNSAKSALELSYNSLNQIDTPNYGNIKEFIASRALLDSQRELIKHNKEWVGFAKSQADKAKEQLKKDMIEYEKYNYLEYLEIKKNLQEKKLKESKELDEIALMRFGSKVK